MAAAYGRDVEFTQPEIDVALALVGGLTLMPLDGGSAALGLVFRGEYATMDAEPRAVHPAPYPCCRRIVRSGESGRSRSMGETRKSESFGTGADGAAAQRLGTGHFPSRSRLSHPGRTGRSPSGAGRDRHVRGWPGKSMGGVVTRRPVCRLAADADPSLPPGLRRIRGRIASFSAGPIAGRARWACDGGGPGSTVEPGPAPGRSPAGRPGPARARVPGRPDG